MLYREIIAVCSQIHTKHINTLCGQNVELLNVTAGGTCHTLSRPFDESCCLHIPHVRSQVWINILEQIYQNISVLIPKPFRIEPVEYFTGALAKKKKKKKKLLLLLLLLLRFVMSVLPLIPPSAWNNSTPTGCIFVKFDRSQFFEKSVEEIQFSLKSDNKNGYFTSRPMYIYYISLNSS